MTVDEGSLGELTTRSATESVIAQRPKKSLGQNFLIDKNIARKIVEAVSISKDDTVLEIGPGKGALTRLIAAKGAEVRAVEKDKHLFRALQVELASFSNLDLINGDFLEYELPNLAAITKIVGNIPYNLTSQIVSKLVDERSKIDCAVLMVQDEVAKRLSAHPGTKDYGSISVRLQLVADVKKLFLVGPTCFRPKPKVSSRVIKVVFKHRELLVNENEFVAFVKKAFGMRRKMFRHFAAHHYGKWSVDLLPDKFRTARIETFTPQEIYKLFSILENDVKVRRPQTCR